MVLSGEDLDGGELCQAEDQVRTFGQVEVFYAEGLELLLYGVSVPAYDPRTCP